MALDERVLSVFFLSCSSLIGISARMGVEGALGQVGLEWSTKLKMSTSLDGSIQLRNGQAFKVLLNTPDESVDLLSFRY